MKIAIYTRTSTRDGRQTSANQLRELRDYARRQKWTIGEVYNDQASGSTGPAERPALKQLFADAARGKFEIVLIWALDRFSRQSIPDTFAMIRRLRENGVELWSFTEEHFRTAGPAGDLLISVAAWIAEQERRRIQERIRTGLERAKGEGKTCHRPTLALDTAELRRLTDDGMSLREVAAKFGVSASTIHARLKSTTFNHPTERTIHET